VNVLVNVNVIVFGFFGCGYAALSLCGEASVVNVHA
jgi:hypothetical protein